MLYDKKWDKELEVELEPKRRLPTKRQPKVKREPWRKLLLDAADTIEKWGWCRETEMNSDGNVCVVGALNAASKRAYNTDYYLARMHLSEYVKDASLTKWNDTRLNKEEVLTALKGAANRE